MFNRRKFLVHAMWFALPTTAIRTFGRDFAERGPFTESDVRDREALVAAMDEIIPRGDGMPSASAAGGLEYLQYLGWQYPSIQGEIIRFLKILGQASAATFRDDFRKLRSDQRVKVLAALEKSEAKAFSSFANYVYEAYYTSPRVSGLLGCSAKTLGGEDDEELLAPVRHLTHLYREVS